MPVAATPPRSRCSNRSAPRSRTLPPPGSLWPGSAIDDNTAQETASLSEEIDEVAADRWLPMREDPLRDHRGTAIGLHLPLLRLPTLDQQRLFIGRRSSGERLSSL